MTPSLLLLQKTSLPSGQWLVLNPPLDWPQAGLLAEASFYSEEFAVAKQFPNCEFALLPTVAESIQQVLLFLPKAKPRFLQLLASLQPQLRGANLWVLGENNGGIKSAPKQLAAFFQQTEKMANAKRCGLLRCSQLLESPAFDETGSPANESLINYRDWQLASLPGLFNKGQVDRGTELLLAHLPKMYGRALDIGCGGGILSLAALAKGAESVLAVDSSAIALAAAAKTFVANGVTNAEVMASDVFSEIPRDIGGSFDWVISNPPFHSGVSTDYLAAQTLIKDAKRYIKSGGRLMIVANRHLPYEQWLEASFKRWEVLVQENGFKVLVAWQ